MMNTSWDTIIIGGGVAGLSAALMLGRSRRRVLAIDGGSPRNRFASHMHGVLGADGVSPGEFLDRARRELSNYDVTVVPGLVTDVTHTDDDVVVRLDSSLTHRARSLIVASGVSDELPDIPGIADRWGSTVLHCPYCHGWEVRGRRLGVLVTSPQGLHQAELVRQWSSDVVVFAGALADLDDQVARRLRSRGIDVVSGDVVEVRGDGDGISAIGLSNGGEVPLDALFTASTPIPNDGFLAGLDLARECGPAGNVLAVDAMGKTSADRIWAVGNVTSPMANVPLSMGAAAQVGAVVNMALVSEEFDSAAHWEDRYISSERVWSGNTNGAVVDVASTLSPGRALDLGCGEGADAIWLAQQGWKTLGVDISATALGRAREAATGAGLSDDDVEFLPVDLAHGHIPGEFDLITASFLQSHTSLPRASILRRAAAQVAPGGHLLLVSHASRPPWSQHSHDDDAHPGFLSPDEEVAALDLDPNLWQTVMAETRERTVLDPNGKPAMLDDSVVLMRRRSSATALP